MLKNASPMNSLALEYVPVPAFEDNYIWVVSDGHHAVVVDPGEAAPVRAYLAKRGWQLSAILLTHHHRDHVGGVADLLKGQAVPVHGPAGEVIEHLTYRMKHGDRVHIAEPALDFMVLDVPGHTSGHIAYFQADDPAVQATLATQLHESVPDRLAAFTLMREWKNRFR